MKKKKRKKVIKTKSKPKAKKLWGLEKRTFNRASQQYMDWDEKMTQDLKSDPEAAKWYSQFNNEYYGNTLNKDWRANLHFKSQKKEIYDATNSRNRDMYNTRYQMGDSDGYISDNHDTDYTSPESALIESIDREEDIRAFVEKALNAGTDKKFTKQLTRVVFSVED